MPRSRTMLVVSWGLRAVAAAILLQTLFFKFTGAPESVYIFSQLGLEPWGRIASGIAELIASVLVLIPSTVAWGALFSLIIISAAILGHLTKLGIELPAVNDHGELFALAAVVFLCSGALIVIHRHDFSRGKEA